MTTYLHTLVERGDYGVYFADGVTFTMMSGGQIVTGQSEVEQFIGYFHEQAFDATPIVKSVVVADGQAALEASFVDTHTSKFLGVAATGWQVNVPYTVLYDLADDKITALRAYVPMEIGCGPTAQAHPHPTGTVPCRATRPARSDWHEKPPRR